MGALVDHTLTGVARCRTRDSCTIPAGICDGCSARSRDRKGTVARVGDQCSSSSATAPFRSRLRDRSPLDVTSWFQLGRVRVWSIVIALASTVSAASLEPSLADAVERQDYSQIRSLLDKGANVNAPQFDGTTALHWAAYNDDFETAKLLTDAGADVKAQNRYGITPLTPAITSSADDLVELLLEKGADSNVTLEGGETALMTASRVGSVRAVKALLAKGADVYAKEDLGQNALMWAAAEGQTDVVQALIEAGADPCVRVKSGFTAFLFAVREGRLDVARLLLDNGTDPNETIETLYLSRRLSREGPRYPGEGMSALLIAATNQHYELAAMLLEAGADPNASLPGYIVLHKMASLRHPGVGDNSPSPQGSGNVSSLEFVRKLVEHGADVNARTSVKIRLGNTRLNKLGATPYFLAAHAADAELMRLLVELGADPSIPSDEGATALMAAAGLGTRSPGEDAGTEEEVLEALQVALEHGADIHVVDIHGETAMHGAAYKNSPLAVEFLAKHGADIKIWHKKNEWGWTPLEIAEGYRFGNFKPSPVTMDALRRVMTAAGVDPDVKLGKAETHQIY